MGKLHQVIAVLNGKKTRATAVLTEVYHKLQKVALFEGLSRRYTPIDPIEGEKFPDEKKVVQYTVDESIREVSDTLVDLFDTVAAQDCANCQAKADVVVDGQKLLSQVPVTHLLFLEKQLTDLRTFVSKMPVLDPAEEWHFDGAVDLWSTSPSEGVKTKKVPRNHVKAEATDKHPAQVEMYFEDVRVGTWCTIKHSGAIPAKRRNEMLARVGKLQEAVKQAREEANVIDAPPVSVGKSLLQYVFQGK